MATQLEIVNNILVVLREDSVSSVADNSYSKLLAKFVNDAKADLEDTEWEWSAYEEEIDVTILDDGTREYELTDTNGRSFLMRDSEHDQIPAAYDVTSGEVGQLFDAPLKVLRRERALTNNIVDVEIPKVFALAADTTNGGYKLVLLWGANTERTWRMYWYVPQAPLALNGDDNSTSLLLPSRAIEMRALYYALNERGEEMGQPGGIAWNQSVDAIGAALERDMQVQKKSDNIDITNRESL